MIKVVNYGSLSTEKQKDVLTAFLKKGSTFVSWDTPLSIRQYMYVEDHDDYEWILNNDADETLKAIVRTNAFLYCYEKSGSDRSRVIEDAQAAYDLFFNGQIKRVEKKLLKRVMYYYALLCTAERAAFLEEKYKESIFCRNNKIFTNGEFYNEKNIVLWNCISDIDEVLLLFERNPRYEVLMIQSDRKVDDFDAAFEIHENAESYDLYITVPDKTEEKGYADPVKKIVGEENNVFLLDRSDLL